MDLSISLQKRAFTPNEVVKILVKVCNSFHRVRNSRWLVHDRQSLTDHHRRSPVAGPTNANRSRQRARRRPQQRAAHHRVLRRRKGGPRLGRLPLPAAGRSHQRHQGERAGLKPQQPHFAWVVVKCCFAPRSAAAFADQFADQFAAPSPQPNYTIRHTPRPPQHPPTPPHKPRSDSCAACSPQGRCGCLMARAGPPAPPRPSLSASASPGGSPPPSAAAPSTISTRPRSRRW